MVGGPMGDRLRPLWDFDDLDASEGRFRAQLAQEPNDAGRAEVLTQLARIEGLRGRFEQCDALLDEAEALGGAEARVLLERGGESARRGSRGRVSRSSSKRSSRPGRVARTCSRSTRHT